MVHEEPSVIHQHNHHHHNRVLVLNSKAHPTDNRPPRPVRHCKRKSEYARGPGNKPIEVKENAAVGNKDGIHNLGVQTSWL